jgi:TIR domain
VAKTPVVFISHDSRDRKIAEALGLLVRAVHPGSFEVFWSSDTTHGMGIDYGEEWFKKIAERLDHAAIILCILTPRSIHRPWILFEAGWAKGKASATVIGIAVGMTTAEASVGPFAQFQLCSDSEDSIRSLIRQITPTTVKGRPRVVLDAEAVNFQIARYFERVREAVLELRKAELDLSGRWFYDVLSPEGEKSHSGHCHVEQSGRRMKFEGFRTLSRKRVNGESVEVPVNMRWYSNWAELCDDGRVRFSYQIALTDFLASASVVLDVLDGGRKLCGDFHLTPPFLPSAHATYGYIEFKRDAPVEKS